ncbi:MAG: amino acid adenylation domain-containing protein, partial [Pyrinomonadaceae bacterium]
RPDSPALVCADSHLSYAALDRSANRCARLLLAHHLSPDTPVGLCARRSPETIAALLGILKAGGAYLPLDPSSPPGRVALLVAEAGASLVLADEESMGALCAVGEGVKVLPLKLAQDYSTAPLRASCASLPDAMQEATAEGESKGATAQSERKGTISQSNGMADESNGAASESNDTADESKRMVVMDEGALVIGRNKSAARNGGARLAYLSFTSGSTGTPKGVAVSHSSVLNLLSRQSYARLLPPQRLLHAAPLAFDAATFELWGALLHGGCCVLFDHQVPEPETLRQTITEGGVEVLWLTSSLFNAVADQDITCLRGVRQLLVGGEALSAAHIRRALEALEGVEVTNGYGPTETTTFACTHRISEEEVSERGIERGGVERVGERGVERVVERGGGTVAIGRPIVGARVYVLDGRGRVVVRGGEGELYIGGEGLARGYMGRAEQTAERFVPDAVSGVSGERLYRTGDLVRWSGEGELEYVGRMDDQVKVRGYRIELGEVEAALREQEWVRDAVVVAVEDEGGGGKRLVAYVVVEAAMTATAGESKRVGAQEIRRHVGERLPEYMVPSVVVMLDEMPLKENGKVDRGRLPAPEREWAREGERYAEPRTHTEELLAEVWAKALGLERVGVEDNYFELGGDSIISIRVVTKARASGLEFRLPDLFSYPTVRELAGVVAQRSGPGRNGGPEPFDLLAEADRARLPHEIEDAYPLTRLQSGMLFHDRYDAGASAAYHCVFDFHLRMRWDEEAMRASIGALLKRHAVLRTAFALTGYSEPLQIVHANLATPLEVTDLSDLPEDEQRAALARAIEQERSRRFDWRLAPLIRFRVFRRSADTLHLVITFPHAVLDGWSVSLLLGELFQHYWHLLGDSNQALPPPPPRLTYRHFVALEQQALEADETQRFWERKLSDAEPLHLPRWPDAGAESGGMKRSVTALPAHVTGGLAALAKSLGVPLKSVLLAAHLRVLCALCGQTDVLTGLVSHGRPEGEDGERLLGLFLNTLPFRLKLRGGTWAELVRAVFDAERELLPHRLYPLADLQRARGGQSLFEVVFNYTHFHSYGALEKFADVMELLGDGGAGETHFALTVDFNVAHRAAETRLHLTYDSSQICDAQATTLSGYYVQTLAALGSSPNERYDLFTPLSEGERQQVLREWNDVWSGDAPQGFVEDLFRQQALLAPDATALVFGAEVLTAGEVERRSNQLGRYLRRLGVEPGTRVGVCAERAPELIVGLLGILKAGAAYVPLDPNYPAERLSFMLEDAGVSVLLTQRRLVERLPASGARVVCLDDDWKRIGLERTTAPRPVASGDERPLYVIYTSGSTGRPKGVTGLHAGALNRFRWMWSRYPYAADEVCCQKTSLGFVDAVWEIFGGLLRGVPTVIFDEETGKDAGQLLQGLARHGVTRLVLVPSLLKALLTEHARRPRRDLGVRLWISSGEALPAELAKEFGEQLPESRLLNLYGSSEVSADVTCADVTACRRDGRVAIGRPIANSEVLVLDEWLRPTPIGTEGEIYVGGRGLACGYHEQPGLTAERFIAHPYSERPGARLYRTGDIGSHATGGEINYLGRRDHQVKVRGHRIELGEIESALRGHEGVRAAAADVREDAAGDRRLVAYYVATDADAPPSTGELLHSLKERLPAHMLPSAFVCLDALPLTASGKVDRRALPAPAQTATREVAYVEPRNALEQMLSEIWTEILGVERIGITHNFFDLGGHSLLATQVITRVWEAFHLDLPLKVMFEKPTIADFGEVIAQQLLEEEDAARMVEEA